MPINTHKRYKWTADQKTRMADLYHDEYSIEEIAATMGCTRETIRYHLLKSGTQLRGTGMRTARSRAKWSGEKHGKWKGGRYKTKSGYVLVLRPNHPYAQKDRYVFEHRVVLEDHLRASNAAHPSLDEKGFLRPEWIVHHKNNVHDDNRICNLEVMRQDDHCALHSKIRPHYRHEIRRLRKILDKHGIAY